MIAGAMVVLRTVLHLRTQRLLAGHIQQSPSRELAVDVDHEGDVILLIPCEHIGGNEAFGPQDDSRLEGSLGSNPNEQTFKHAATGPHCAPLRGGV